MSEIRVQPWLLPYENPLAKRIGPDFFKSVPKTAGIYLMRGVNDSLLYVGKAKNLRARINSYRRAKPDQVSRKVIRMVNLIVRIEWQECESEEAALLRENALLREHKPPFNVVNTQPESYYFIAVRFSGTKLEFRLTANPQPFQSGTELFGTYKGRGTVRRGYSALLRLLWASHQKAPERFEFPAPLVRRNPPPEWGLAFSTELMAEERARWEQMVRRFLNGTSKVLLDHLMEGLLANAQIPPFMYHFVQEDLEALKDFFASGPHRNKRLRKAHGLKTRLIAQDQIDDLLVTFRRRMSEKPKP